MTPFEIIIIVSIYLFFYGYIMSVFMKEENIWLKVLLAIVSFVLALYVPAVIGSKVFEKLNNKKS